MPRYFEAEPIEAIINRLIYNDHLHGSPAIWESLDRIRTMPTADVAPVVHGAWVVDENSAYIDAHCSECGMQVRYNKFQQFDCFCRRCGARMDGAKND